LVQHLPRRYENQGANHGENQRAQRVAVAQLSQKDRAVIHQPARVAHKRPEKRLAQQKDRRRVLLLDSRFDPQPDIEKEQNKEGGRSFE
jgi:hypothetical protein